MRTGQYSNRIPEAETKAVFQFLSTASKSDGTDVGGNQSFGNLGIQSDARPTNESPRTRKRKQEKAEDKGENGTPTIDKESENM